MKIGTSRVENFSDGVISIIITIMVLTIKIPDITPDIHKSASPWLFRQHLEHLWPYLITYAFSFMMIGIFWLNHHHMFHLLEKTDEALLVQNLFFLFWMSLIPISTAFAGANPLIEEAVAFYGFVMMMTTLAFAIMRAYSIRKGLVHTDRNRSVNSRIYKVSVRGRTKNYMGVIAYFCSVPLAFVNIYLAFACFIVPPILFFIPDGIDDEELAEKISDKNVKT